MRDHRLLTIDEHHLLEEARKIAAEIGPRFGGRHRQPRREKNAPGRML
jgi:hypothetical protein